MITAAERRAKIEKLKRDREIKEQEKKQREEAKLVQESNKKTSNDLITEILKKTNDNKEQQLLDQVPGSARAAEESVQKLRSTLRVSSYVAEILIVPQKKPTTYEKDVQCDLEVPKPRRLDVITEDGEWDEEFDQRFEQNMRQMNF